MSIMTGKNFLLSYDETELECPICTFRFDASEKIEKAKLPVFKMKCPGCKSLIGVSIPVFGGNTKCFEWDTPTGNVKPETEAPFKVNGEILG